MRIKIQKTAIITAGIAATLVACAHKTVSPTQISTQQNIKALENGDDFNTVFCYSEYEEMPGYNIYDCGSCELKVGFKGIGIKSTCNVRIKGK